MHEYDIALKGLLKRLGGSVLFHLTGVSVERWHNVELPEVRNLRVDLPGETADRALVPLNCSALMTPTWSGAWLNTLFTIRRQYGRWPVQFVLYVGQSPMRMPERVDSPAFAFHCRMMDIREFDAEPLLSSPRLEDNIVAVLTRLRDERADVRRILEQIAVCDQSRRESAMKELTILEGLRKLGTVIEQEISKCPFSTTSWTTICWAR